MITTNDPHSVVSNVTDAGQADSGKNPETGASIDKVRDILFGGQMRDVERRFARLEERLVKETTDLRDDVRKRLDTLERYMRPRPTRWPISSRPSGRPRRRAPRGSRAS